MRLVPIASRSSRLACVLVVLSGLAACVGNMPPPPELRVTSPERGTAQGTSGPITVLGNARPGASGSPVVKVTVNDVPAVLAADGSFTATIVVPDGATLLQTVAFSEEGGAATDARAVQVGARRPVGSTIERAVTAAVSTDAFARLAEAAGPLVSAMDLQALLAPLGPIADLGDSIANVKLTITRLALGRVAFTLVPVEGGLQFSATIDGLDLGANAAYAGILVPDGTTAVGATADRVTLAGTLVVTPAGTSGLTTRIASPSATTTNLRLQASGLAGQILDLLNANLRSTVQNVATKAAELALQPLVNSALGALGGPQRFTVLGRQLELEAAPAAVDFTARGALVTLDLAAAIAGSEASPGFVFTPNGTPTLDVGDGVQVGLADDLVNELLAEIHALGLLDLHLEEDFGVFDTADLTMALPPMVDASRDDGALRLVLGDMVASFRDHGTEIVRAAINAQVDLQVDRGASPEEIALEFGEVRVFVNILDTGGGVEATDGQADLSDAAATGIGVQLDSLGEFLVKIPVPKVAGVTLDSLALHADGGYVVASGQLH